MRRSGPHLKRYAQIARLLWKHGRTDLVRQMSAADGIDIPTPAESTAEEPGPLRLLAAVAWLGCAIPAALALNGCASTTVNYKIRCPYGVDDPQFGRTVSSLLGPPLVSGTTVTTLQNGDAIFPAMLDAIRSAMQSITFETYVYWSGSVGVAFADALSERAAAGVQVRVLIDAVGGQKVDKKYIERMRKAGAKVVLYHPLKWFNLTAASKLDYRTHRKLLVIDGKIGFTGGVGIADAWLGNAQDKDHWRDTHYRIEGPVVAELQAAFLDNWMEVTGEVLDGIRYFPAIEDAGTQSTQLVKSSARGGSESMHLLYLLSIAASRRSICLSTPYFVPDEQTSRALVDARARGVRVQIVVPGSHIDEHLVREASRSRWGPLLEAGVEINEYQPTMFHCKLMIVDELWTSVGSANLSSRSFGLNSEANLNVLDAGFAAEQKRVFDEDVAKSKRITYSAWQKRPLLGRIEEVFITPLIPQL